MTSESIARVQVSYEQGVSGDDVVRRLRAPADVGGGDPIARRRVERTLEADWRAAVTAIVVPMLHGAAIERES